MMRQTLFYMISYHFLFSLVGRPVRLPKETFAVPGTAVEIVATSKYDVKEEQVVWSRVTLVKGKEKEGKTDLVDCICWTYSSNQRVFSC